MLVAGDVRMFGRYGKENAMYQKKSPCVGFKLKRVTLNPHEEPSHYINETRR